MKYIYLVSFILALPLMWNVLLALRFEGIFKKGSIWQIRCAYILVTVILSHFLAETIYTFTNSIYALF